jgi:hypothetical protein
VKVVAGTGFTPTNHTRSQSTAAPNATNNDNFGSHLNAIKLKSAETGVVALEPSKTSTC